MQHILSNSWSHRIIFGILLAISVVAASFFFYCLAIEAPLGAGISVGVATAAIPLGRKLNIALLGYQARNAERFCIQNDIFLLTFDWGKKFKNFIGEKEDYIGRINAKRAKINQHGSGVDESYFNKKQKAKINRMREIISSKEEQIKDELIDYRSSLQDFADKIKEHDDENAKFYGDVYNNDMQLFNSKVQELTALVSEESDLCAKLKSKQLKYIKQIIARTDGEGKESWWQDYPRIDENRKSFKQKIGSSNQPTYSKTTIAKDLATFGKFASNQEMVENRKENEKEGVKTKRLSKS